VSDNERRAWAAIRWLAMAMVHVAGVFFVFLLAEVLLLSMR